MGETVIKQELGRKTLTAGHAEVGDKICFRLSGQEMLPGSNGMRFSTSEKFK